MQLLATGPSDASIMLALAHGAGAPMDSAFMNTIAVGLAAAGVRVVRFEFPYMQQRRSGGRRRAPDPPAVLQRTWKEALAAIGSGRIAIGGKSMGGRIASMIADETGALGLVCLGYPFHPPGRPAQLRTAHLETLKTPTLIVQGTRDALGRRDEVAAYGLPERIAFHWIDDGDHSFKPRAASGRTLEQNLDCAIRAVGSFLTGL